MNLFTLVIGFLSYPVILVKLFVNVSLKITLINLVFLMKGVINPMESRAVVSRLVGESVERILILLNELNEPFDQNLCEWDFLIDPVTKFFFQHQETFAILITTFIVVGCLHLSLELMKSCCCRGDKGNRHDESIAKIKKGLLVLKLDQEKQERFDYYTEHLEALVESVEEDIGCVVEKKKK